MTRLIAAFLLSVSPAFAADETRIVASIIPDEGVLTEGKDGDNRLKLGVGQMVRLQAGMTVISPGEVRRTSVDSEETEKITAYMWQFAVIPSDYNPARRTLNGGRDVFFATGKPGEYPLVLTLARDSGDGPPLLAGGRLLIVVGDGKTDSPEKPRTPGEKPGEPRERPDEPEQPGDKPPPEDDDIDGLFGLGPKVRDKVNELVPAEYRDLAKKMADAYRKAAEEVIDGQLTITNAAKRLRELSSDALTTKAERDAWKPFLDWLGKEMGALATSGKLTSAKDVVAALSEISLGFGLVK